MGPTGTGKTDLALDLFDEGSYRLINVDSVQVYKGLDIGSGKISKELLKSYPHSLLDIIEPEESYSVARFKKDCLIEIEEAHKNGEIPLLVGGTMLYFNTLVEGISDMPESNEKVRKKVEKYIADKGLNEAYVKLSRIDPLSSSRIHCNDKQRIQRALEVFELTNKPLSDWQQKNSNLSPLKEYDFFQFSIDPGDREEHKKIVKDRFLKMIENGLVEEVKNLLKRPDLTPGHASMKSVGYRQVCNFLLDKISYDEMIERSIISTRQLAKRQMTWLRKWSDIVWLTKNKSESTIKILNKINL
tara:strand:- start:291 stop:1193 length:903 start_codon:yes stop_codon:yes gene_type:complete